MPSKVLENPKTVKSQCRPLHNIGFPLSAQGVCWDGAGEGHSIPPNSLPCQLSYMAWSTLNDPHPFWLLLNSESMESFITEVTLHARGVELPK